MNKDPYATAEESASVMAKNVNPGRKSAIEKVAWLIAGKFLDEQGVSDAAYTRGLHEIAVNLAEKNAELLEASMKVLEWFEAEDDHSKADFYQRMQMCRDAEEMIRAAIAKATGQA